MALTINKEELKNAIEQGNAEELIEVLERDIEARVQELELEMTQAMSEGYNDEMNDPQVIAKYGLRKLSKDEFEYFQNAEEVFEKQVLTFPVNSYNRVFEDLRLQHPLLSRIQFRNTTGVTQWLMRTKDVEPAWWGPLCEEVKKKLTQGFKVVEMHQYSLSVAIFMCKAMLKLSPQWLEKLIREMLLESMLWGIEKAIIEGKGVNEPIGMLKDPSSALDQTNGHSDKIAKPVKDFSPKELGALMAEFSKGRVNYKPKLSMIVNPLDYWNKIFPQLVYRKPDGGYIYDALPVPIDFIQSTFVPEGKAIMGNLDEYFFGVASPVTLSDSIHYQFIERNKVYIAEMYANGKPLNDDSFLVLDISKVGEVVGG